MLAGGYVLRRPQQTPVVTLAGADAVLPEVLAAEQELTAAGIAVEVVCVSSADLLFRALQSRRGLADGEDAILDELFPADRATPLVTVLDGHPHTLGFLAAIRPAPITCLGVDDFGQSGDVEDLYRHFGIDADTIAGAALDLI